MKPFAKQFRGYTLIELIVALGMFAVIMTLAAGAYFVVLGVNREARALSTNIDNLSFALENMTRSIRTGTEYDGSGATFTFTPADSPRVTYTLDTVEGGRGVIKRGEDAITDSTVDIDLLSFTVTGQDNTDNLQPRVTIVITGTVVTGPGTSLPFTVQTGATMRGIDL